MTRGLLIALPLSLLATVGMAMTLTRGDGASAQVPLPLPPAPGASPPPPPIPPQQFVLKVGDSLRVEGAPIGCQVTQRSGRPFIECRRGGSVAGTYGTFLSERTVTVARFRTGRTAQTILTARHGGTWRACRGTVRRNRDASMSERCR